MAFAGEDYGGGIAALVIARTSWTRGVRRERDALRAEDHKRKPKNQHHGYPHRDDHDPDPRPRQARTGRTTWRHVDISTKTATPNSAMTAVATASPSRSGPHLPRLGALTMATRRRNKQA